MKAIRLIFLGVLIGAIFTVSAFAQVKIGVINTSAFTLKEGGITKFVAGQEKLNAEFKPVNAEINNLVKRINGLKTELKNLQKAAKDNPKIPIKQSTINSKVEEHDRLVRQYNFKADEIKVNFSSRSDALLNPIKADIYKAVRDFAKEKGYVAIWDINQLLRTKTLLAVNAKTDVTKEFIKYYNARPAGTATK